VEGGFWGTEECQALARTSQTRTWDGGSGEWWWRRVRRDCGKQGVCVGVCVGGWVVVVVVVVVVMGGGTKKALQHRLRKSYSPVDP
jgi:hypothetical protein